MSYPASKEPLPEEVPALQESQGMDLVQQVSFHQMSRGLYCDTVFDRLLNHVTTLQTDHHSSIEELPHESSNAYKRHPKGTGISKGKAAPPIKKRDKQVKTNTPNRKDYQKNICGYIARRAVRQFTGTNYTPKVLALLQTHGGTIDECRAYYTKKVQFVTGPSHLPGLLTLQPGEEQSLRGCKKAFLDFFKWFLKYRYLRYLLREGKMADKQAYIHYKNHHLLKIIESQQKSPSNPHEGASPPLATSTNQLNQTSPKEK